MTIDCDACILLLQGASMSIYDFSVKDTNGQDVSLASFEGKLLLIVNTATHCGFTSQYAGLQKLYDEFLKEGLVVLDFPCNQFRNQAPGTDSEINDFCTLKYKTTFPRFAKIDVNGSNESPLYTYLKSKSRGIFGSRNIKWNFTKFLVNKSGEVVGRYAPTERPENLGSVIREHLD